MQDHVPVYDKDAYVTVGQNKPHRICMGMLPWISSISYI